MFKTGKGLTANGGGDGSAISSAINSINNSLHSKPDVYRVEASAYSSAIDFDKGIDNDYKDNIYSYAKNVSRIDTYDNRRKTNNNHPFLNVSYRETR